MRLSLPRSQRTPLLLPPLRFQSRRGASFTSHSCTTGPSGIDDVSALSAPRAAPHASTFCASGTVSLGISPHGGAPRQPQHLLRRVGENIGSRCLLPQSLHEHSHSHSLPPHHRASRCHRNTSIAVPAQHSLTLLPYRWLSLWPALQHRRSSLRSRQRPPVHVDGPLACLPFCPPTTPVRHQASAPAATAQLPHQPSQHQRGRARLRRRSPSLPSSSASAASEPASASRSRSF